MLSWTERNSLSNLSQYISAGVDSSQLLEKVSNEEYDVEYKFLQWGLDSKSMLINYFYNDTKGDLHIGYFWYNCENGKIDGIVEI